MSVHFVSFQSSLWSTCQTCSHSKPTSKMARSSRRNVMTQPSQNQPAQNRKRKWYVAKLLRHWNTTKRAVPEVVTTLSLRTTTYATGVTMAPRMRTKTRFTNVHPPCHWTAAAAVHKLNQHRCDQKLAVDRRQRRQRQRRCGDRKRERDQKLEQAKTERRRLNL